MVFVDAANGRTGQRLGDKQPNEGLYVKKKPKIKSCKKGDEHALTGNWLETDEVQMGKRK